MFTECLSVEPSNSICSFQTTFDFNLNPCSVELLLSKQIRRLFGNLIMLWSSMVPAKKFRQDGDGLFKREFAELAESLSEMCGREGLKISPFADQSLPYFSKLSQEGQRLATEQLRTTVTLAERLQGEGKKICKSKTLVWAYLSHMGFTAPSDLQNHISDDNEIIDVYNVDHRLIFANLTFFQYCSYSLEEQYSRTWYELYLREDPNIQNQLLRICQELVEGRYTDVLPVQFIGTHRVREVSSRTRKSFDVSPIVCSPIFERGRVCGYLWVNKIKEV